MSTLEMGTDTLDIQNQKKIQNIWWYISVALAELIGTGMLVFMGCSSVVPGLTAAPQSHLQICLVFGIAVSIIIQTFGHVSGAHLNPAVTVAACIFQMVSIPVALLYAVSQIIGAILGYATLLVMTPKESLYSAGSDMNVTHGLCTTVPNENVSAFQALLAEYFATSILIFICCGIWDKRNATKHDSVPIKFGLAISGLALALGPYSGASMNPARSFGPALLTGVWTTHWVYWVGPLAAGLFISYFYKFVFDRVPPSEETDQSEEPLNQINSKVRNAEKTSNEGLTSV